MNRLNKLSHLFVTLGLVFSLGLTLATITSVQPFSAVQVGAIDTTGAEAGVDGLPGNSEASDVYKVVETVINILSIIAGAAAVILIVVGGFRYIISGGDAAGIASARNTILYAIIGLVIVIFAQTIVKFVLSKIIE